jgi:DNA modification methylase
MTYYESNGVTLHHGDALEIAKTLDSQSVQTIVTSPPYYGLRDYGASEQIGSETSLTEYVARLVELFREMGRVLRDDGTLWLNLGDTYAGRANAGPKYHGNHRGFDKTAKVPPRKSTTGDASYKNLLGVPWRVAFALQDDGWILRSDIVWAKPNPMPESVADRPTRSHEFIFLLTKRPTYFYNAAAIRDADSGKASGNGYNRPERMSLNGQGQDEGWTPGAGKNKRDVWTVVPGGFPGAHFAVYPPELIRPCILAGSAIGDTVLDPFNGSGTTGMVARQEGRNYVGIDVNKDYLDLALATRFAQPVMDVWGAA